MFESPNAHRETYKWLKKKKKCKKKKLLFSFSFFTFIAHVQIQGNTAKHAACTFINLMENIR